LFHNPGLDESHIRVIYHASKFRISKDKLELRSRKKISPSAPKSLLYVGARSGYKNFSILIPVIRDLIDDGWNVQLTCIGGGKFSAAEIQEMHSFQVFGNIRQLNSSDEELRQHYQSADCHITTSLDEGFGLPLLEAMSLGCPTIITATGSLKEISKGNSLEFESREELAEKIISVIGGNSLPLELSHGGHSRSLEFDWKTTARETVQLYKEMLEEF
jgi:glycosyltransferase involved in cell wall biosynthesis